MFHAHQSLGTTQAIKSLSAYSSLSGRDGSVWPKGEPMELLQFGERVIFKLCVCVKLQVSSFLHSPGCFSST